MLRLKVYAGMIVAGTVAYGASEADKKMHYVETDAVVKSAKIECYIEHGKKFLAEKSTDKMAYMDCDIAPEIATHFAYDKSDIHHRNTMTYSFKSPVDGKTYVDNYETTNEPLASLSSGKHFKMYAHKSEAGKSRIN
jgi:hypothetical protein